ncbi:hypothetical protein [cf. Phormidesmis sp. LEGE 11477]|uniref:hypothetical protein n=1 Tax=cf. Phormidesmis sp. LEGE 11477 TaxID=1828680 RepID=UPI001880759A|nr:hypothetical protein [cf. Phormidesmis sp. LEGE 11477]MBE9060649.1 hypothetical protein [cf. Phormidesmis sp. LEGE 11477]
MPLSQQPSAASSTVSSTASLAAASGDEVDQQPANDSDQLCWIQIKGYPYHPDHQVELLHLQAEADALMIKLQAAKTKDLEDEA